MPSMVSYMQYEPFYHKSNMAADAMLDLKKKDIISETAEDRNLVLVSILLFYTLWKSLRTTLEISVR